ncbi:MAG: hypothetical protein RIQ52_1643 [Pseudomonadota bacterium]|jgi:hypothetical protein
MSTASFKPTSMDLIGVDAALRRAAKRALETALQLGTPCWVMEGDQIVDLTQRYQVQWQRHGKVNLQHEEQKPLADY